MEKKDKTLTTLSGASLLIMTMMGTGINFMPMAFKHMGFVGSWIALITVGIFTFFSLIALVKVAEHYKQKDINFLTIARDVSYFEYVMMNLGVFFNCFFATVTFYRFLSNTLVEGCSFFRNLNTDYEICRKYVVFILLPLLVHLSLKDKLINLKLSGWLGTFSVFYLMILIIFYSITIGNKAYSSPMAPFNTNYKLGLPFFVSCMVCQPNMIGVYMALKNKSKKNILILCFLSSLGGLLSYGLIGFCGYYIFGTKINSDIMKMLANMNSELNIYIRENTFDKYNLFSKLAFLSMISLLTCGFPLQMLPVAEMVTNFIYKESKTAKKTKIVTLMILCCTLSLVLIEKFDITLIKRLSGAIFSTAVGLLHPFIFLIHVDRRVTLFNFTCILIGLVTFSSILYTIYKLIEDVYMMMTK